MVEMVLIVGAVLLLLSLIVGYLNSPSRKGRIGESIVNRLAARKLDRSTYHVLANVTLETRNGTTQIDHVIVSKYGVFVIETKHMSGWIFGSEKQRYWTQTFPTGDKYRLLNPLHQNYSHVKVIQDIFNLKANHIHNLVVFTGDCDFMTDLPENVTQGRGFIRYIKNRNDVVFTPEQVEHIVNSLSKLRLEDSKETDMRHIEHVQKLKQNSTRNYRG